MEYSKDQDFRYFMTFWKHQYAKRNACFFEDVIRVELGKYSIDCFFEKYGTLVYMANYYISLPDSSSVMHDILDSSFDYGNLIVEKFSSSIETSLISEEYTNEFLDKLESTRHFKKYNGTKIVAINFDLDIEAIVSDIRLINASYKQEYELEKSAWDESCKRQLKTYCQMRRHPKGNKNLTRAIGLWLWDFICSNEIMWKNRAKAYKAFHERYHAVDSAIVLDGYRDDKQLAELLDLAGRCIDKMNVLPGS